MYFKLLNEEGDYQKIDTKERVNLVCGNEIYTPLGKISKNNLQGYVEFDTIELAMEFYNIEIYEPI